MAGEFRQASTQVELVGDNALREVMNAKEAADFLRLSKNSFRHIAPSLPRHKRLGMSYRYLRSELLEWLVSLQGGDIASLPPVEPRESTK